MAEKITMNIRRPELYLLLLFLAVILFLELRVSISSPIAFGDEGFHTRMAQFIAENKEYPVDIPFEKTNLFSYVFSRPPLWNLSQAGFYLIVGFNDIIVKILNPFIAMMICIAVFLLGKRLWNKEVGLIASIIAATIPSFVTYSILFYTDILLIFYLTLFVLTYYLALEKNDKKYLILSGAFAALSVLTKTPGIVVFPIIGLSFLYLLYKRQNILRNLRNHLIIAILIFLIIGGYLLRNLNYYGTLSCNLPIFDRTGCSRTMDYESTYQYKPSDAGGTEENVFKFGLINYVKFAYGKFWFISLGFLSGLILLSLRRSLSDIFVLLVIVSFFPIFYLGSGGRTEDSARYMLGFVPIIAVISGNFFERLYDFIKNYFKNISTIVLIVVLAFVISQGYISFKDKISTMKDVKKFSPLFFEACEFVKEKTSEDALFFTVWDSQTTYNCQRNVIWGVPDIGDIVSSNDVNLAAERLKAHGITHVFIQKFSINPRYYPADFVKMLENNSDKFNKIYENGPDLQQCISQGGCDGAVIYEVIL